MAEECNTSICLDSLTRKLKIHWVAAKLVPRILTQAQRDNHVDFYQKHLDHAKENENFMKRIII